MLVSARIKSGARIQCNGIQCKDMIRGARIDQRRKDCQNKPFGARIVIEWRKDETESAQGLIPTGIFGARIVFQWRKDDQTLFSVVIRMAQGLIKSAQGSKGLWRKVKIDWRKVWAPLNSINPNDRRINKV